MAGETLIYVSPNGNASGTGTIDSPLTLIGARDKVRTINSNMTNDIIVYLRGGTHVLTSTYTLTSQDSGTNGFNIIYKPYNNEKPIISGGQKITGWSIHDSAKNIWKANVSTGLNTRQLFVNGVRAIRAKSSGANKATGNISLSGFTKTTTGFTKPSTGEFGNMQNWGNKSDIELVCLYQWRSYRVGVSAISGDNIVLKQPAWDNTQKLSFITMNWITWIENAYELLTDEGEFYLDRTQGAIFYKPRANENMSTANVIAPVLETLIDASGTLTNTIKNIKFFGITFSHATNLRGSTNDGYVPLQAGYLYYGTGGGATNNDRDKYKMPSHVTFKAATSIVFERNVFTHLGGFALNFENGSQNNIIVGNKFKDIGGTAITIGHVNDAGATGDAVVKGNVVRNNYITEIGFEYQDGVGIFIGFTDGTIVDHNEMHKLPYTGITCGWGWSHTNFNNLRNNQISYNLIYDVMNVVLDGGAVYMLNKQQGTTINNNYMHHVNEDYGTIYLDQGCESIAIDRNVLAYNYKRTGYTGNSIFIQDSVAPYAYDNIVTNTYVNDGKIRVYSQNSVQPAVVTTGDNWGTEALSIINAAGIELAYRDIRIDDIANPPVDPPASTEPPLFPNELRRYYVSPTGTSNGTGSLNSPLSLQGARDLIRTTKGTMTGDIYVLLRGGTYTISSTFNLTNADSGTNGFNIIYRNFPNELPTISGGRIITEWTIHDSANGIWKSNVGTLLNTRHLYVNGKRAQRARGLINPTGFTANATGFTLPSTGEYSNMANWNNSVKTDIEVVSNIIPSLEWKTFRSPVVSITGNSVTLNSVWSNVKGKISWIENAYELLTDEGEWYLNRTQGIVYYKPRANEIMSTANVVASELNILVSLKGNNANDQMHHIKFYGINFSHAGFFEPTIIGYDAWQSGVYNKSDETKPTSVSAIEASYCNNIIFERNIFDHMGSTALSLFLACQNNSIIGNKFQDISGSGIRIGSSWDSQMNKTGTSRTLNNVVKNNYINKIGVEWYDSCGILVAYGVGTIIDHNEMHDMAYTGVSVGHGWTHSVLSNLGNNIVSNNNIYDVMNVLRDGGAVYMLSKQTGTVIKDNYLHDIHEDFGTIYLDQGCEDILIDHNVMSKNFKNYLFIQNSWAGTDSKNAFYNTVQNNWYDNGVLRVNTSINTMANNRQFTPVGYFDYDQDIKNIIANAGIEASYIDIKNDIIPPDNGGGVITPPTGVNIALNKLATSSSSYDNLTTPDKANDSNKTTLWSSSIGDTIGWWQVDLSGTYIIDRIDIIARQDIDQDFARSNFEVRGSNIADFSTYSVLGTQGITPFPAKGRWSVNLSGYQSFRYIRIVTKSGIGINFSEFEVYGEKQSTEENIALGKLSSASSTYSVDFTSDKGNDGDTGSLWSSVSDDPSPYWSVDLGSVYDLKRIEVVARKDIDQPFARSNFEVRGSNTGDFISPTQITTPISQMKKLGIYYGYPSLINGANGNLTTATAEFNKFDVIVFPDGVEHSTHGDHTNSKTIITNLVASGKTVFGYVAIGVTNSTANFTISTIQAYVDEWVAMGAQGIFYDEYGFDYGVTRARQNTIVDYAHSKGLKIMANSWEIDDALGDKSETGAILPAKLNSNDWYILESFVMSEGNISSWGDRSTKTVNYKKATGVKMAALSTAPIDKALANDSTTDKYKMAYWISAMIGLDAFQWTDGNYSASNNILRDYVFNSYGTAFTGDWTHNSSFSTNSRTTDTGTISVNSTTGSFVASGVIPPSPSVLIGSQGSIPFPHQGTWSIDLINISFRYLRFASQSSTGANFAEFRVYGKTIMNAVGLIQGTSIVTADQVVSKVIYITGSINAKVNTSSTVIKVYQVMNSVISAHSLVSTSLNGRILNVSGISTGIVNVAEKNYIMRHVFATITGNSNIESKIFRIIKSNTVLNISNQQINANAVVIRKISSMIESNSTIFSNVLKFLTGTLTIKSDSNMIIFIDSQTLGTANLDSKSTIDLMATAIIPFKTDLNSKSSTDANSIIVFQGTPSITSDSSIKFVPTVVIQGDTVINTESNLNAIAGKIHLDRVNMTSNSTFTSLWTLIYKDGGFVKLTAISESEVIGTNIFKSESSNMSTNSTQKVDGTIINDTIINMISNSSFESIPIGSVISGTLTMTIYSRQVVVGRRVFEINIGLKSRNTLIARATSMVTVIMREISNYSQLHFNPTVILNSDSINFSSETTTSVFGVLDVSGESNLKSVSNINISQYEVIGGLQIFTTKSTMTIGEPLLGDIHINGSIDIYNKIIGENSNAVKINGELMTTIELRGTHTPIKLYGEHLVPIKIRGSK